MELFKFRPLALACGGFLITLYISFHLNSILKIATLILIGVAFGVTILICIIKKGDALVKLVIRLAPSLILVALALLLSIFRFDTDLSYTKYCDSNSYSFEAVVDEVTYTNDYMGYYNVAITNIDNTDANIKVRLNAMNGTLTRGDKISGKGSFHKIENAKIGFDSLSYNLSKGIFLGLTSTELEVIGNIDTPIKDMLEETNNALCLRFNSLENEDASALLSALLLGEQGMLKDTVKRDFSRCGLSHILALSGMHIAIIVSILGFALDNLPIDRVLRDTLLILSIIFFIGMTGLSSSAIRAGIMVAISILISRIGGMEDSITCLFLSVTLICIFTPYSIFSLSLILSFFAMLGCIISGKFLKRVKILKRVRLKLFRFAILTIVSSIFALIYTLPIVALMFRSISILSPITNVIIAPLFSLLIYLSPFYLLVADVPFVSVIARWLCVFISDISLKLGELFSKIDRIVIPLISKLQIIAVIIIISGAFIFLVIKRKYARHLAILVVVGFLLLGIGTGLLYIDRSNNTYVGTYSYNHKDVAFIEDGGNLAIVDIASSSKSDASFLKGMASYLGYFELDSYIITEYSTKSPLCFDELSSNMIVKNVYLPLAENEKELLAYNEICEIAKSHDIAIYNLDSLDKFGKAELEFNIYNLKRSQKKSLALSIQCNKKSFTYLSASAFEICDYKIDDIAYYSDIAVFGAYGPSYKIEYSYDMPYLDYAIFLGNSKDYIDKELLNKISEKEINYNGYPIRFKLSK